MIMTLKSELSDGSQQIQSLRAEKVKKNVLQIFYQMYKYYINIIT